MAAWMAIDRCDEAARACESLPPDEDGDGHPTADCLDADDRVGPDGINIPIIQGFDTFRQDIFGRRRFMNDTLAATSGQPQ